MPIVTVYSLYLYPYFCSFIQHSQYFIHILWLLLLFILQYILIIIPRTFLKIRTNIKKDKHFCYKVLKVSRMITKKFTQKAYVYSTVSIFS